MGAFRALCALAAVRWVSASPATVLARRGRCNSGRGRFLGGAGDTQGKKALSLLFGDLADTAAGMGFFEPSGL